MQRIGIFFFLTLVLPSAVYWASHNFEHPGKGIHRFVDEIYALRGGAPAPVTELPPAPMVKRARPQEPAGQAEGRQPELSDPPEPDKSRYEKAQELYDAGRFEEAAASFAYVDEKMRSLALLGKAFGAAFAQKLPEAPYYVVTTGTGSEFEGFGVEHDGQLTLTRPGGGSLALPRDSIRNRTRLSPEKAVERLARQIAAQGAGPSLSGTRMFALVQQAFLIGRPAVAGPLLPRLLELDGVKPCFLSSVRNRAAPEFQEELYRAFGRCMLPPEEEVLPEIIARAPRKLGDGQLPRNKPNKSRSTIRDKKAVALLRKAAPHRTEGKRLHSKVLRDGLKRATVADIDKAVRELETAIGYYEQAVLIEDNNEVHALLSYCSRLAFQLRFWREQVVGR